MTGRTEAAKAGLMAACVLFLAWLVPATRLLWVGLMGAAFVVAAYFVGSFSQRVDEVLKHWKRSSDDWKNLCEKIINHRSASSR